MLIRNFFLSILGVATLLAFGISLAATDESYMPRVNMGNYYFQYGSYTAEGDLWVPLLQSSDNVFFTDIRAINYSTTPTEANFGVGFRHIDASHQHLYGIYSFYDHRNTSYGNTFNQITLGGEFRTPKWFVGMNGYLPVGSTSHAIIPTSDDVEIKKAGQYENIYYNDGQEEAMAGADVLVGYELFSHFTTYVGGYYFRGKDVPNIDGPKAMLTYSLPQGAHGKIFKYLNSVDFETEVQHDNPRGTNWFVGLRLGIGLGKTQPTDLARDMSTYIYRDFDLVSQKTTKMTLFTKNGRAVNIEHVDSQDALRQAMADSMADIIVLDNAINLGSTGIKLGDDKTLTGGGYDFTADSRHFGVTLNSKYNGALSADTGNLIEVGADDTIRDLHLTVQADSGSESIFNDASKNLGHLTIDNVTTNGQIKIGLDGADVKGTVSITNDEIDLGGNIAQESAIDLTSSNGANLTVSSLSHNEVEISGYDVEAIELIANKGGHINVTGGIYDDEINMIGKGTSEAISLETDQGGTIDVTGFYGNDITGTPSPIRLTNHGGSIHIKVQHNGDSLSQANHLNSSTAPAIVEEEGDIDHIYIDPGK